MTRPRHSKDAADDDFSGFTDAEEIGFGAVSAVYRARETGSGQVRALKVISLDEPDPDRLAAFGRELATVADLRDHENIVSLFRTFPLDDGRPVLVLELCDESLADRLAGGGTVTADEVLSIGSKLADALAAAHGAGLVHRAVTPANVRFTASGEPALGDLGVAALLGPDRQSPYLAPELRGGADPAPAADVYGLAATLHHLLTGRAPNDTDEPRGSSDVPSPLLGVIIDAMSGDPTKRPGAAQFGDALRSAGAPDTSAPAEPSRPDEPFRPSKPDDVWSSATLSRNEPPAASAPPPAEQTVRRADLQASPPPESRPPAAPQPPAEQTVRRSMLPPQQWTEARAPQPLPPQSLPPRSLPPQQPAPRQGMSQSPELTVKRSSLPGGPFVASAPPSVPPPVPQNAPQIMLDPAALARRITLRSGRSSMIVDESGLLLRAFLRKNRLAWNDISGFQVRLDDPSNPMSGYLVAMTRSGPVDLPATKRDAADLRYTQALLEAYRVRSQAVFGR